MAWLKNAGWRRRERRTFLLTWLKEEALGQLSEGTTLTGNCALIPAMLVEENTLSLQHLRLAHQNSVR